MPKMDLKYAFKRTLNATKVHLKNSSNAFQTKTHLKRTLIEIKAQLKRTRNALELRQKRT